MGEYTRITRAPAGHTTATTPSPGTRWAGSAAAPARAAGHELARISISAPVSTVAAPIQREKWKWDAAGQTWVGPKGTSATPPTHTGSADGEEYDDTYSQSTDPTVTPHLKKGAEHFGESGAEEQLKGKTPSATDIRELAVTGSGRRGGSGLHEVIPTNMRGEVAKSKNEALIGVQSGMRTSTDYQTFSPSATGTGEVGGHTGMFRNPTGSGSTHTSGQAAAHDTLRDAMESVKTETDADVVMNTMALAHLKSTPTGQEVLQSPHLTGATPNVSSIGTLGPVDTSGKSPDPERLALAQDVHQRREHVKARERGRARERDPSRKRLPSPSPERTRIDSSGKGGEYVKGDRTTWSTAPVPSFKGKGWKKVANEAAWLTQPQRHPFDVSKAPLVRPTASSSSTNNNNATTTATPSTPVVVTTQQTQPLTTTPPVTTPQPLTATPQVKTSQPLTATPSVTPTQPLTPSQPLTSSLPLTSLTAPTSLLPPPSLALHAPVTPTPPVVSSPLTVLPTPTVTPMVTTPVMPAPPPVTPMITTPTPPTVTPMVTTPTPPTVMAPPRSTTRTRKPKRKKAPAPSPTTLRRNPKRHARGDDNPFG